MNDFQKKAVIFVIGVLVGIVAGLWIYNDSEREQEMLNRMVQAEQKIRICPDCRGSGFVSNPYNGNSVPCSNCCGKGKYIDE